MSDPRWAVLAALLGSLIAPVSAQELVEKVDFSKPPSKVEAYNKVRFAVTGEKTDKGLVLTVKGDAYYPDGVVLKIAIRYWKKTRYLTSWETKVKDQKFELTLPNPIAKELPGGAITVEAWFALVDQTSDTHKAMKEGKFFSCTPPCQYDQLSVARTDYDLGGAKAQASSEALEKTKLQEALKAALAARQVAQLTFNKVRRKEAPAKAAKAALDKLGADLQAALHPFEKWSQTRTFLLFPGKAGEVRGLGHAALVEGQLHAAVCGVKVQVEGGPRVETASGRVDYFTRYAHSRKALEQEVEGLKGFLAEKGTLDRLWKELAEKKQKEVAGSSGD